MTTASDFIWPIILLIVGIAWWRERRRDKNILALQDKLIAEQKHLLLVASEEAAVLKARLTTATQAHRHTLERWEHLIDRRGTANEARPDIDAVLAERRARPSEFIVHAGKLDSASLAEFKRAWNATDPNVKLVAEPKDTDDAA